MNTVDYLILAAVCIIFILCTVFIYKSKKNGKKCIGCPDSCACSSTGCGGCKGQCHQ